MQTIGQRRNAGIPVLGRTREQRNGEARLAETIQVITTTATKADTQAIANTVVGKRLAACAQVIGPITSTYWWQGKIEVAKAGCT